MQTKWHVACSVGKVIAEDYWRRARRRAARGVQLSHVCCDSLHFKDLVVARTIFGEGGGGGRRS